MDTYTAQRQSESRAHIDGILEHCEALELGTVFDVGSGTGLDTFELASRFRSVVAIDSRADFIRRARRIARERGVENITFLAHDALKPLPAPQQFDFVYCNNMSHHVASRCMLLDQLAASVKPGGWLFISEEGEGCPAMLIEQAIETRDVTTLRDMLRQVRNALGSSSEFRVYLQGTLEPLLETAGFEITRLEYDKWEHLPHLQRTWARAVAPRRLETGHPDYLDGQELEWKITPLLGLADALYPNLAPTASLIEKVRRRGPHWAQPAQPDWERADELFTTFKDELLGAGSNASPAAGGRGRSQTSL